MDPIKPQHVRFINLGEGGKWAASCIKEGTIRLGYESPLNQECLEEKWELVNQHWLKIRKGNKSTAANDLRQIRDFYELEENDAWITFFQKNCTGGLLAVKSQN
jgi:hypothetical protein